MRRALLTCLVVALGSTSFVLRLQAAEKPATSKTLAVADDVRFAPPKDLDGYFPFTPPATKEAWAKRSEAVRTQTLVSQGLWPMPTRTPLKAVVHGKIEREDFTVERVFFESFPGFYVTGSLYRPKGFDGPRPTILCPHGHWKDGRFYDAGDAAMKAQLDTGAEKYPVSGRFPLQARCIQLARLGCIVFHYDMLGYADSQQIPFDVAHRYGARRPELETKENWGLFSPQAESRLQHILGLQTWNSIRALDFVESLSDVDAKRIGVTGASGGGTQTFLLGACDPRPAAIVPAVMVSTAMQGGCTCENSCVLRVGTGNIELAGLFAPKPLGMIAANDWTKEIMTKGYPELQQLYKLLGAPTNVAAFPYIQFPHNYNYVSRAAMYGFFNEHLKFGAKTPIVEADFKPLTREELTVWTGEHKQPAGGPDFERKLLRHMTEDSDKQIAALAPKDMPSLVKYHETVAGGIDAILGRRLEDVGPIEQENLEKTDRGDYWFFRCLLTDAARREVVPVVYYYPKQWNKQVVVWVSEHGSAALTDTSGDPSAPVKTALAKGYAVAGPDVLGIGAHTVEGFPADANRRVKNPRLFAGFTYGYNFPLLAQRVHDILTVVAHARRHEGTEAVHLGGGGPAAPWVAAAGAQCGDGVDRLLVETGGFRFAGLTDFLDANFVPGIVKYGDLPALLALRAPQPTWLAGETEVPEIVKAAYAAAGAPKELATPTDKSKLKAGLEWLLR